MKHTDPILDFFFDKHDLLLSGKWGLEKETLRTTIDGRLAGTPHPEKFGSKLQNPFITTDFSESQIEMVTPAFDSMEKTLRFLDKLQAYVEKNINGELLWNYSMPCNIGSDDEIQISSYDDTPAGLANRIYRSGLANRYGKKMQIISGIHYNFSFGKDFWDYYFLKSGSKQDKKEFRNEQYLRLARNYLRYRWILIYLFGASPAAGETFEAGHFDSSMINKYKNTATSLRMSPMGYSSGKNDTPVSFDSLEKYLADLERKLITDCEDFEKLGLYENGNQIQLNFHILQKESELYSPVRLKSGVGKNKSNFEGLKKNGIEYLEFRSIDLDPFYKNSVGITLMRFMHAFLVYCLFAGNESVTPEENAVISDNDKKITLSGRQKDLMLKDTFGGNKTLEKMASELIGKIIPIARMIDLNNKENLFQKSVNEQVEKIKNPEMLPSSKITDLMERKRMSLTEIAHLFSGKKVKGESHALFDGGI